MRKLYLYLESILAKLQGNPFFSIDSLLSSPKIIYLIGFSLVILVILILWIILILIPLAYLELQGNNVFRTSVPFNYFDNNSNNIYHCEGLPSDKELPSDPMIIVPSDEELPSEPMVIVPNPNKRPFPFPSYEVPNPPKKLKTLSEILKAWPGPTTYRGRAVTADAVIRADWNKTLKLISNVKTLFDKIASGVEYDKKTKEFILIRKEDVSIGEFNLMSQKLEELQAGVSRWAVHMAYKVNKQQEVDKDYYVHTGKMVNSPQRYYELYIVLDQLKDPNWFYRLDTRIEKLRW